VPVPADDLVAVAVLVAAWKGPSAKGSNNISMV
jgi:hypothetical protein